MFMAVDTMPIFIKNIVQRKNANSGLKSTQPKTSNIQGVVMNSHPECIMVYFVFNLKDKGGNDEMLQKQILL
jgi:hypothetical protein